MTHINKKRIWSWLFFKQFVWLIIPLCFWGAFKSCSSYIKAGAYMTPKTVYVSGYTRSDGTYVRPYTRRPPGGAIHDAPYERRRGIMILSFAGCLIISSISVINYINTSRRKIISEQKRINFIEEQKRLKEKEELMKNIVRKMNFDFNGLKNIPSNISLSGSFQCKFCYEYIGQYECHIAFKARTNIHHVCIECAKKSSYLGKSQPIKNFVNELNYADMYKQKMTEFIEKFNTLNKSEKHEFNKYDIENQFVKELKTAVNIL